MYSEKVVNTWTKNILKDVLKQFKTIENFRENKIFNCCFALNYLEEKLKESTIKKIISKEEKEQIFKNLNEILLFSNKEVFYKFTEEKEKALYFYYFY